MDASKEPVQKDVAAPKTTDGQHGHVASNQTLSPTHSPVSAAGAPRTKLTLFQKVFSFTLFSLMWASPQFIHRSGFTARIGHEITMPFGYPSAYTGTATPANLSFFFFYTAWIRYMSTIVSPRHRVRLETASIWIPNVIAMLVFSPLGCIFFVTTLSYYGVLEYRDVLASVYPPSFRPSSLPPTSQHEDAKTAASTEPATVTPTATSSTSSTGLATWPLTLPSVLLPLCGVCNSWQLMGGVAASTLLFLLLVYPPTFGPHARRVLLLDLFALLYVSWCLALAGLMSLQPYGRGWFFLGISCSWIGDAGAYFVGSRYGRHKCFPLVSPGKSWEGIASQLFFSLLATWMVLGAQGSGATFLGVPPLSLPQQLLSSLLLTVAGVTGDLSESFLKRIVDVKDSGNFFPGHGGILDRFDGFLFSSIALSIFPLLFSY